LGRNGNVKLPFALSHIVLNGLLTNHLKEVHDLVAKTTKLERPSISKRDLQHQDHVKMNVHILGDAMAMQRQNDQKLTNHIHAKAQHKWNKLVIVVD